jgi:hypothetical protein
MTRDRHCPTTDRWQRPATAGTVPDDPTHDDPDPTTRDRHCPTTDPTRDRWQAGNDPTTPTRDRWQRPTAGRQATTRPA